MSNIREWRSSITPEPAPRGNGHASLIAGAIGAFVAGSLLVYGWNAIPTGGISLPSNPLASKSSAAPTSQVTTVSIPSSSKRLGQAEFAPAIRTCMSQWREDAPPDFFYKMLKMGSLQVRVQAALGQPDANHGAPSAWTEFTHCVYAQNSSAMCNADNRALAVESLGYFFKHTTSSSDHDRLLIELRDRLKNGILIASDFGLMVPAKVRTAIAEVKPVRNACPQS